MVLALMIFYVNSSGYTEATVLPGAYFFAASAVMTMLAYGWANTAPPASIDMPTTNRSVCMICDMPFSSRGGPQAEHRPR